MNEQIQQFAEQAGLEFDDNLVLESEPIYYITQESLEKFAELIVEKCAAIIESQDVDPSFKLRMSWAVKQYFGVKQ